MTNRRDIWRDFMGRFEPSADPRDAVERGFYIPRPGRSLAEQLAARFELKPAASHLLMGGIGSGKTTQLLVARDRLNAAGDVSAVYVDVSLRVEPNCMTVAAFFAVVALALARELDSSHNVSDDLLLCERFLNDREGNELSWIDDDRFVSTIGDIVDKNHTVGHIVLLVDSLDRMTDLERFAEVVEAATGRLRAMRLGVILVGPLTAAYGVRRTTMDLFDRTWQVSTLDARDDPDGRAFLLRVLRARDPHTLIDDSAAERLVSLSGGVLRDLIALTQASGEEAYVDGVDRIERRHVEIAAEVFGRKQLFAIDSKDLAVLERVRSNGTFVQTSEKDLALLATRRVLEYTDGNTRFAVHPTIEPLLAQIPKVA